MDKAEPTIRMQGIVKTFPGVVANDGVDFDIYPKEIHALLGENGAGKTTLMNILYGLYKADAGSIFVNGKKVSIKNSLDAQKLGIGMVHQHFSLIPSFTVLENISIGLKDIRVRLNLSEIRSRLEKVMVEHKISIDLDKKVEELSVGEMQRVEILKLLFRGANVLILDEPTSSLTPQEVEVLFTSLRSLVKEGRSVVIITHKLYEVFEISDRITVLKQGKVTFNGLTAKTTQDEVVEAMIGRGVNIAELPRESKKYNGSMKVEGLCLYDNKRAPILNNITFELKMGEIIGIAAVAGNGEKELIESIFGMRKISDGKIYMNNVQIEGMSIKGRVERGLGYMPEERLTRGIAAGLALSLNSVLHDHWHDPYLKKIILNEKETKNFAKRIISEFNVNARSEKVLAKNLSGGNIQKFIVGRELLRQAKYILAVNPTAGLDIGATENVRKALMEFRNVGGGVLLYSEDLDELLELSDRIMVMYRGRIVGTFERKDFDKLKIGALMLGKGIS
ncbi:MAG: ABC transporter ATP-binding protein [Nitrososphaeria archaeon]